MRLAAPLLLLASCTRAPSPARFAISHGSLDSGDPAVAALLLRVASCGSPPVVFCSGSLIAPRALLTAAHCLDIAPIGAMVALFGSDAGLAGEDHAVLQSFRHPTLDLAVLALDRAASPALLAIGPAPSPGDPVRLVGFGADENNLVGPKRQGTATVETVSANELRVLPGPALACGGDSGGPLLYMEQIAGVTSYGDANCSSSATYARLDGAFLDESVRQIAALPESPRPSPSDLCHHACSKDGECPLGFTCNGDRCTLPGVATSSVGDGCDEKSGCSCAALEGGCFCLQPCVEPGGGCSVHPARRSWIRSPPLRR